MRVCQICDHNGKRVILSPYDMREVCLFECTRCGHRYIDALDLSQEWFDNYYLTQYTTDDKPHSDARLYGLAEFIAALSPENVLDIGGMDGELQKRIVELGYKCDVTGVGKTDKKKYDCIVLSHTLEHVYDLGAMFERINKAINDGGYLVVEIPVHVFDNYQEPTAYDCHWQHVNKFRPRDIAALLKKHGFTTVVSTPLPDYREYACWRIVGMK
jgi:hypothetical protein